MMNLALAALVGLSLDRSRPASWVIQLLDDLLAVKGRKTAATDPAINRQDNLLRGWPWVDDTFSWAASPNSSQAATPGSTTSSSRTSRGSRPHGRTRHPVARTEPSGADADLGQWTRGIDVVSVPAVATIDDGVAR